MNFIVYIDKLKSGETVKFRPTGHSMTGRISSGQLVTVIPVVADTKVETNDIVLCKVKGRIYLHLVSATKFGSSYQISNNHGHVNGWTVRNKIYGKVTGVEN